MPWASSSRRDDLPADWPALRQQALDRDGHRCVWPWRGAPATRRCTLPATEVDHVRRGDDHRLANLQSLCHHHHAAKTARESAEVRAEQQAKLRFPETYPKHPGLK